MFQLTVDPLNPGGTGDDQNGWKLEEIPNGEKLISALTVDDLRRAALKYLRTDNYVRVSLYPENYQAAENK